ncbi:hypothetical protein A3A55_03525 [Candidatus Roizmanbacteria bacterium RIFCSPLOWO2_01_FULL_40_14]|uniref:Phosphoglycerate mutase n=1 Tax=Candidatus Gottesmanbacteria bacterium GW2011_GWB1_43_11 TaxID=1618446 RepID=A0A0G1FJS3_9BACT|nr:MAG: hypothetical protein UV04_C0007G0030 [Candidatus Gottesmanbacteria bacterium GW2011_GWA2_42_16]KKS54473.1 MAG: hypothetical protein UV17_C0018G0009 [Candidatus Gottesmanbacteria bacterium GW2011_GWA1_42_26]KKS82205.1 MAG: hypothetical protein UV55_C0004G0021 [Candidatus Gottesmanbacteria bacterium GW2011_GWC1_43_10]KKS87103.1 MAG: hypothetical protein UV61_C0004G0029 [Candidatus Gottesmanbacteria bacterium GW2011_GWB1_43_11]OGG10409.1 MAG: hypothetical protein A2699_05070 [Candidatus Go
MFKTVILCRHGEVDNPRKVFYGRSLDISLSEAGKKQIDSLGRQIREMEIEVKTIHSSPLLRAKQTSEILSKHLKLPIWPQPKLVDVHIPAFVGKPLTIRKELHAKGEDEYSGEWVKKGNESGAEIAERMLSAFQEINASKEGIPLIVSHGDPLAFLHFSLGFPGQSLISISEILRNGYGLKKGSAIILKFDKKGGIKSKKTLIPKE